MAWDQEDMIRKIGHDGSEIAFPDLEDPYNRRAFHVQEIIPLLLEARWVVTPIDATPVSHTLCGRQFDIEFKDGNAYRYQNLLTGRIGVIAGANNYGVPHAVAWDGEQILDPVGKVYPVHLFQHQTFWMCNPIK